MARTTLATPVISSVASAGTTGGVLIGNTTYYYKVQALAVNPSLQAVWGFDASNVWAGGDGGLIIYWNGSSWVQQTSGVSVGITSIFGFSASDVWAVGFGGTIIHWNGATWSTVASGTTNHLFAIWGASASDVWAVGDSGTIRWWNGATWAASTSGTVNHLRGVMGSSSTDVQAVGGTRTILNWNGVSWAADPITLHPALDPLGLPAYGTNFSCITVLSSTQCVVGIGSWHPALLVRLGAVGSVWGYQSFVHVGPNGALAQFPSAIWGAGGALPTGYLWALSATGNPIVRHASVGAVYPSGAPPFSTTGWNNFEEIPFGVVNSGPALRAIWSSSATDAWAVGDDSTIMRWNGSQWTKQTAAGGWGYEISAISAGANGTTNIGTNTNRLQVDWATVTGAGGFRILGRGNGTETWITDIY